MAPKINLKINLKNVPKSAQWAIGGVLIAIVVGLFLYLGVLPKRKQINSLEADISKNEQEITKKQSMADKLDELKIENAKLKGRLEELSKQLPPEKEISVLLKQVADLGKKAGLTINSWRPSDKRNHASGIVFEVPVSVDLIGSYHRLAKFFSSLTRLDRIVNIIDIKLSSPKPEGSEAILSVGFSAITYTDATQGGIANTVVGKHTEAKK